MASFQGVLQLEETLARSTTTTKMIKTVALVVAQLVERLLLTPEICSSNPDIGKNLSTIRNDENKEKI